MPITPDDVDHHIRRRPSVHQLCLGPFTQHSLFVSKEVLAVPLGSAGFGDVAQLVGDYVSADLCEEIENKHVDALREKGKDALPSVALVWHPTVDAPTEVLVTSATSSFSKARQVLSWVSGEEVAPVAYVVLHTQGVAFQVMPPRSRKRQRLWFGAKEVDQFELSAVTLATASENDSNLGFALELFHDAVRESNDLFRIVRLYNVLECLAAKHKEDGVGSRDAVRAMLGMQPGPSLVIAHKQTEVRFDLIAVSGKLRDKILHGAPLTEDAFAVADRGAYSLLLEQPLLVANELQWRIEHEISSRATAQQERPPGAAGTEF